MELRRNQCRVRLQTPQTDSITGTSIRTPDDGRQRRARAGAEKSDRRGDRQFEELLAPISAPGAATEYSTRNSRIRP